MKQASCGAVKTRLFVPVTLTTSARVTLSQSQIHKVRNVLRLAQGESVGVFNGKHGEWKGSLDYPSSVYLESQRRPQDVGADLWLIFVPLKQGPIHYLIEKATELGVSKFLPVLSERAVVRAINRDKLRSYAIDAAEQSDRLNVPEIEPVRPLSALLSGWPEETPHREMFLCAENGSGSPILKTFLAHNHFPAAILTGPEGGFTPKEFEYFSRCSFITPIDLGSRLLRAETAAQAAITCWQAACGEWILDRSLAYSCPPL